MTPSRRRLALLLLLAVMAMAADDAPTAKSEMLGIDAPDSFEVGFQTGDESMRMLELVDPPETVDNWTKLITLQLFFSRAKTEGVEQFYERWQDRMRAACPGMTDAMVKGTVDGKLTLRGTLACPKNPQTGKPENLEAFLVQGDVNQMMVQVAFRRPLEADDTALVERVARSLKVCDQRTLQACNDRKATGFVPSAGRTQGR